MSAQIIFHIDLDAFFASVEQRDNPSLAGKPVIVGADPKGGKGRGVVSTCSYEARKFGIRSAMPISQAYQRCPHGIFLPPDMDRYHKASEAVFNILKEFSPDIEPVSCDEAFLDMTGSCHLFGTPKTAGTEMKRRIRTRTGLTASVGIAPIKMAAKIASDYCKPDGLLEILPDKVLKFLHPLSINSLWGVGPKTGEALKRMGVMTIGELAAYDRRALNAAFGVHGDHLHLLANGIDDRPVEWCDDVKSVSHEETFDQDTYDQRLIFDTLLQLSEKVSARLRSQGLKGRLLTLKVRFSGFQTYSHSFRFSERTNHADVIFKKSKDLFIIHCASKEAVRLVGVRMSNFDDGYVKDSLFVDQRSERNEAVHRVLDGIREKFGHGAIHRAGG
ncbi:MAG: DNA polymerase IV [Candidatus Omnitrophota bacterium]